MKIRSRSESADLLLASQPKDTPMPFTVPSAVVYTSSNRNVLLVANP